MIRTKIISSLEKVFLDQKIDDFSPLEKISVLKGERLSFQIIYTHEAENGSSIWGAVRIKPVITGALAEHASIRRVFHVPVSKTLNNSGSDDNYIRKEAGLFPDILRPLYYDGVLSFATKTLSSAWVEIEIPESFEAGEYTLSFAFDGDTCGTSEAKIDIEVINAVLPSEDIYFTQWFHADCLANYYNVEVWSDRHFEIVENFVRTARRNGINTLLTPVFTPPLDTAVGGERRTTQLVQVAKSGDEYSFDFSLLDRWIEMCDRCKIDYLEISHLFTQWGASHAPKIMATVDGEYKKIFGWETDAVGEEYSHFLRLFLSELLTHLKKSGNDQRCFFHISDEPSIEHLESYSKAKSIVADILDGYTIIDALSKYEFYEMGVVEHPIPSNNHIKPFIDGKVNDLWTYYCVSQNVDVSNRFHSMPAWRNRSIGMQIYKYNIVGFLQWGYNFYNNQFSGDPINPYYEQSCDLAFPGGDAFSVYPETDGTALESPRLVVFYEALQDIKAMKLAEKYTSHEEVVSVIEKVFGKELTFATCTTSSAQMLAIREAVNDLIKSKLNA